MPVIARSVVSLRIFGDDLDPKTITAILGREPTRSRTRGDQIGGRNPRLAKFGSWILSSKSAGPTDFGGQVRDILESLNACPSTWATLNQNYRCDMFCGLFMREWNEGFTLEPVVLAMMAERGLKIGFDVYGYDGD